MKTTVRNGQSLLDIALQECGDASAAFELALRNGLALSDELTNGDELELPTVEDKRTVAQYRADSVFPATAITGEQYNETIEGEGVEFWGIEFDFIVS